MSLNYKVKTKLFNTLNNETIYIPDETSFRKLVNAYGFITSLKASFDRGEKDLQTGLNFSLNGYTSTDWLNDIKTRIQELNKVYCYKVVSFICNSPGTASYEDCDGNVNFIGIKETGSQKITGCIKDKSLKGNIREKGEKAAVLGRTVYSVECEGKGETTTTTTTFFKG